MISALLLANGPPQPPKLIPANATKTDRNLQESVEEDKERPIENRPRTQVKTSLINRATDSELPLWGPTIDVGELVETDANAPSSHSRNDKEGLNVAKDDQRLYRFIRRSVIERFNGRLK